MPPTLAKALADLSKGKGRQSLIRFRMTEGNIAALDSLGVKEFRNLNVGELSILKSFLRS